MIETHLNSM